MGRRNAMKENEPPEEKHGHHSHGCHHNQAVVPTGRVGLPLPERYVFWVLLCTMGLVLDHPSWAYWASFASQNQA